MMRNAAWSALAFGLIAGVALAESPKVGEEAPDFGDVKWVMNDPGEVVLANLRGEVIFVERWGVNCGPCKALIPHVEQLQQKYGGKGLHIFAFESQGHAAGPIVKTMRKHGGKTFAVAEGGPYVYKTNGGVPFGWLIGIDGKVIWAGNPGSSKFDQALESEMKKVRFPGLGRTEFSKDTFKSIKKYMSGKLADARKEAEKLATKTDDEAVKEEASYLVERYTQLYEQRWDKAQGFESEGRFLDAMQIYAGLGKAWKGAEEGKQAEARVKFIKGDDNAKAEMKAEKILAAVLDSTKNRPPAERKAQLEGFVKKFEGTYAARQAAELLEE